MPGRLPAPSEKAGYTQADANQPDHVHASVDAIARLDAEHERDTTPLQRLVGRITARVGRPASVQRCASS